MTLLTPLPSFFDSINGKSITQECLVSIKNFNCDLLIILIHSFEISLDSVNMLVLFYISFIRFNKHVSFIFISFIRLLVLFYISFIRFSKHVSFVLYIIY